MMDLYIEVMFLDSVFGSLDRFKFFTVVEWIGVAEVFGYSLVSIYKLGAFLLIMV